MTPPTAAWSRRNAAAISPSYEVAPAGAGQLLHRPGEIAERQAARVAVGRRHRRQPILQVDAGTLRIAAEIGGGGGDLQRRPPVGLESLLRQGHGRRHHLRHRQPAPGGVEPLAAGDRARHRDGQRPMDVGVALDLGPAEALARHPAGQAEIAGGEVAGRDRTEIHHLGPRLAGAVNDGEAAIAAETGVPRLLARQRHGGGDRGVDRVAAGLQDGEPRLGAPTRLRDDDAAPPGGRGLGQAPVLGERGDGRRICHAASARDASPGSVGANARPGKSAALIGGTGARSGARPEAGALGTHTGSPRRKRAAPPSIPEF